MFKFIYKLSNREVVPTEPRTNYYKWDQYIRVGNWDKWFNTNTNMFEDARSGYSGIDYLSLDEFNELYKNNICNCPVGAGSDIHTGDMYYNDDLFEDDRLQEYYTDNGMIYTNEVCPKYVCMYPHSGMGRYKVYYKKACIACGTCLDEYEKGIQDIEMAIDVWIRHNERDRMVDEICGGN